jgi:hypothetical protein
MGTKSWEQLSKQHCSSSTFEQQILFLHLVKRDLHPSHSWLCFECNSLHLTLPEIHSLRKVDNPFSSLIVEKGLYYSPHGFISAVLDQHKQLSNMLALEPLIRDVEWKVPSGSGSDGLASAR